MEFRKTFLIDFKDYYAFNFFHNKKKLIWLSVFAIAAAPLLWISIGIAGLGEDWWLIFTDPSIFWIYFFMLLLIALNFFQIWLISKRQYKSSKDMKVDNEVIINGSGIEGSNQYGNHKFEWQDIYKAAESKKAFYIYISKLQAHVIPKRFIGPGEAETIRVLIKQNLPPKKYRLNEDAVQNS